VGKSKKGEVRSEVRIGKEKGGNEKAKAKKEYALTGRNNYRPKKERGLIEKEYQGITGGRFKKQKEDTVTNYEKLEKTTRMGTE